MKKDDANDNDILPYVVRSSGPKTGFPTTSTQFYRRWTRQCAGRWMSREPRTVVVERRKYEQFWEQLADKNASTKLRPQSQFSVRYPGL